eukprot:TRINITY_DN728_c0_g1_i1.p1 TRINITY_DN728_c0_g1~~TRINITY_DN728_c0_g1_i1.p1  ORF type:complete len:507 (+),score=109.46 TRINITY_DN728_c0_g1_i1:38-1522(+)
MAAAAKPGKRSLLQLLSSSRAKQAACLGPRCARCRGPLGSANSLRCRCGFVAHGLCTYPPLQEAAVAAAQAADGGWSCDACIQASAHSRSHDFCCVCAVRGPRLEGGAEEPLLQCSSCRASFHPSCTQEEASARRGDASCPACSNAWRRQASASSSTRLKQWSLELAGQASDPVGAAPVPLVRGIRLGSDAPPGTLWRTSEIVHVLSPRTLLTRTGHVIELRGPLCLRLAEHLKVPRHLVRIFKAGFPKDTWQACLRTSPGEHVNCVASRRGRRPAQSARARKGGPQNKENEAPADGTRQAKRARAILNAQAFGAERDFLDFRPAIEKQTSSTSSTGQPQPASPASLDFLSSLHTGCTPEAEKGASRHLETSPAPAGNCRRRLNFGNDEEGLGAFNSNWVPNGIDGFICEARARRSSLRHWQAPVPVQRKVPAPVQCSEVRKQAVPCAVPSETDQVESSDEEDLAPPIAVVPLLGSEAAGSFDEEVDEDKDLML